MKNWRLEPCALRTVWQAQAPLPAEQWKEMLRQVAESIARECVDAGPCLIGHIKGFARFPDEAYLQVSCISADMPADVGGNLDAPTASMELDLNIIVYGVPSDTLLSLVKKTLAGLALEGITIEIVKASAYHLGSDESALHEHP